MENPVPLDYCSSISNDYFKPDSLYLSSCRSAIGIALDQGPSLKEKVALVPSFTCSSVLSPFLRRGFRVIPYPIKSSLSIDWQEFKDIVSNQHPSVILLHPYFGFDTIQDGLQFIEDSRRSGVRIIEDLTQCLFSSFPSLNADFFVGSLRKWMPIPDGAFLSPILNHIELDEDTALIDLKMKAMLDKGKYICGDSLSKEQFLSSFKDAELLLNTRTRVYAMSQQSITIFNSIDIDLLKRRRRENYLALVNHLLTYPFMVVIKPTLPEEVVPFEVAVLVKEGRKRLQDFMASNNVYPTVIWSCPNEFLKSISDDTRRVYDEILCFHCDQRYTVEDMNRIGDLLKLYYQQYS